MANIEPPENLREFPLAVIKNMIVLATSGFGVVVALAWNEFIRTLVTNYINPILGTSGGMASLFIYAALMTLLAVLVTMQLAQIQKRLELFNEALAERKGTETLDTTAKSKTTPPAKKPAKK